MSEESKCKAIHWSMDSKFCPHCGSDLRTGSPMQDVQFLEDELEDRLGRLRAVIGIAENCGRNPDPADARAMERLEHQLAWIELMHAATGE